MKNWIKLLLIFLFFFVFSAKNTEARSGCCSGHGGVNCSAGAQGNGKVICNDGWRGSSCSYSGMVMCGGSSTTTTTIKTVQPTSIPRPTLIPTKTPTATPTKIPTTIPTDIPIPTITPSPSPIETPTLTPTPEVTKKEEISPTITPQPQVLGETDIKPNEPLKTSDYIITFSVLGLFGFGVYKLIIRIKNFLKKNDQKNS